MSKYEIWEKILDSNDLNEMRYLLEKVIDEPEVIDLFIQKFSSAKEYATENRKKLKKILGDNEKINQVLKTIEILENAGVELWFIVGKN